MQDNTNNPTAGFGLPSDLVRRGTRTLLDPNASAEFGQYVPNYLAGFQIGDTPTPSTDVLRRAQEAGYPLAQLRTPQAFQIGALASNSAYNTSIGKLPEYLAQSSARDSAFDLENYKAGLQDYYGDKQFNRNLEGQMKLLDRQSESSRNMFNRQAAYNIATSGSTYKNLAGMI